MTQDMLDILTNIIGGVESGGQIYGNRRYETYGAKGAITPNEKTCTLGWAGNYGYNATKLCQMIFTSDSKAFREVDKARIESMLRKDWVRLEWDPTPEEKTSLIAIITTDAGKKCQDELFQQSIQNYLISAQSFGVDDVKAQMMWCEIQHLGGLGSVKRVFNRAVKPYTPESIYASLLLDQADSSSENQVGDKKFQSRHECCVRWINQYVKTKGDVEMAKTAESILAVMRSWIGYSRANGKHKEIIDIYNNDKPLPRGYKVQYTDSYCDTTVSAAAIKSDMKDLIGKECGCQEHINIFKKMNIWNEDGRVTPKAGWIVLYNWDTTMQPNDGYADHIGIVESVKDGTIVAIEGNYGGEVKRRSMPVGWGPIRGYAIPNYDTDEGQTPGTSNNGGSTNSGGTTLSREPKWVGEATTVVNVRKWAGIEYANLKSVPVLGAGNKVDVCDEVLASNNVIWYYVRINGTVYGFVNSNYIKPFGTSRKEVGEAVTFAGTKQYTSSYAGGTEVAASSCIATVTQISEGKPHPYLLVGSKVHGWVNADDIR